MCLVHRVSIIAQFVQGSHRNNIEMCTRPAVDKTVPTPKAPSQPHQLDMTSVGGPLSTASPVHISRTNAHKAEIVPGANWQREGMCDDLKASRNGSVEDHST